MYFNLLNTKNQKGSLKLTSKLVHQSLCNIQLITVNIQKRQSNNDVIVKQSLIPMAFITPVTSLIS